MELPEVTEPELENGSFSAAGPAEYSVSFGTPCKVGANVRVDKLLLRWPRLYAEALVAVYKCGEFWPHFDVKVKTLSAGETIYVLVDSVARHLEQDAELAYLEKGVLWNYAAKLAAAAVCKTLREVLRLDHRCKTYHLAE
ncbi:MAG: hypothetical protein ABWK05_06600 [Pyrobaculum sp.]